MDKIEIRSIGKVRESKQGYMLEIFEPYREALESLDKFSHVKVFWWAHRKIHLNSVRSSRWICPMLLGNVWVFLPAAPKDARIPSL